jgi:oligosaccharide repeat unit polymerase
MFRLGLALRSRTIARATASIQTPAVAGGLGACLALSLVSSHVLDPGRQAAFVLALVAVSGSSLIGAIAAYRLSGRSLLRLTISPFSIAAITWLVLFVFRPLELYVAPDHGATSLVQFGFELADLTRAVALAGVGCALFSAAYLLALGRFDPTGRGRPTRRLPLSGRWAAAVLAVGTVLWGVLFIRQGGPSALVESAASIRVGQGGSFYGFVGVWLVQGTALYALAVTLQRKDRTARRVLAASVVLTLLAALALQLRGLFVVALLAGLALFVVLRPLRRRHLALGAALAVFGVFALGATQQIRAYSNVVSTEEAVRLTARTPIPVWYVSDLSTFDNLVAIRILVPDSIEHLDGQTLAAIPEALVPRFINPDKSPPVDSLVASYLYPGIPVGIPISFQGELYWNGGLLAVILGAPILGLALGLVGRLGLRAPPGSALFIVYAVLFPFTHALLTRSLAAGLQSIVFALVGVGLAIAAASPAETRAAVLGAVRSALPSSGRAAHR